ncbi:Putative SAM-dependent methyltransferase [Mesobacillus persicus]|uniref:Putative SAM-dependent methyltransferase n=1 Tax=Mesobacillus persicus TaxID=930146 RepID=A0A1H8BH55_9BACI|nr:class I SAM-dependent methyltransferase [Mesobacillus persicus]SEM82096.1 Putative SAM-dependent methyltransferase [Mesobacillus persicus]
MIITTAGRTNEEMVAQAQKTALDLESKYVTRKKRSVLSIMEIEQDDCLVVGKNRLELYPFGEEDPFFFHPNSSMFRIKRILKGESDPFIEATQLKAGMSILDCTLGLASDSIVASFAVGESGRVAGIEANPYLAYIVRKGLSQWDSGIADMNEAMRRITAIQNDSLTVLKQLEDNSYDCIYFDPMFEETVLESDGIRGLTKFARRDGLSVDIMKEAYRVARRRIVLKDHFRSTRFDQFHFSVYRRKTAKFHFGVIKKT